MCGSGLGLQAWEETERTLAHNRYGLSACQICIWWDCRYLGSHGFAHGFDQQQQHEENRRHLREGIGLAENAGRNSRRPAIMNSTPLISRMEISRLKTTTVYFHRIIRSIESTRILSAVSGIGWKRAILTPANLFAPMGSRLCLLLVK
jgi:hypothetical protein